MSDPFWDEPREASATNTIVGCAMVAIFACSASIVALLLYWAWSALT